MASAAVAAGIVGVAAILTVGLATVSAAAVTAQRVAGAADAAALAAADTASGAVSGVPCERAADLAERFASSLVACEIDGLIATVTVSTTFAGMPVRVSARAGPPP
ncbi:Rv3654c family TadE-like protein [Microbacterium koreense]|uniref:Rv3654c family TadE-like protein n=2 Tax=Microbacterium koreense TaxID=323761 RepID=A0ABW2ZQK2_9MICO